ncbi:MAG: hypothetical protein WCZ18_06130 [Ottowia sp.]|nr:hypothetical protein [Ottowia sp.]
MNDKTLRGVLEIMTQTPGIRACALVKTTTGTIWHRAGDAPELAEMAHAAAEHWELYRGRGRTFRGMGPLVAGIMIHEDGRMTLLPCGNQLILLILTDQNPSLDWDKLQRRAHNLARFIARSGLPRSESYRDDPPTG